MNIPERQRLGPVQGDGGDPERGHYLFHRSGGLVCTTHVGLTLSVALRAISAYVPQLHSQCMWDCGTGRHLAEFSEGESKGWLGSPREPPPGTRRALQASAAVTHGGNDEDMRSNCRGRAAGRLVALADRNLERAAGSIDVAICAIGLTECGRAKPSRPLKILCSGAGARRGWPILRLHLPNAHLCR